MAKILFLDCKKGGEEKQAADYNYIRSNTLSFDVDEGNPRDITNLNQRITDAIAIIDEGMLQQTWQEIEYRLDVLRATNSAHIEVY